MNPTNEKIKGQANATAGKLKVAVGKLTDNNEMKLKGEAQKLKGDAQKVSGSIKASVSKGYKKAGEAIKNLGR